jgi:hypothetical protein
VTVDELANHLALWEGFGGQVLAVMFPPADLATLSSSLGLDKPLSSQRAHKLALTLEGGREVKVTVFAGHADEVSFYVAAREDAWLLLRVPVNRDHQPLLKIGKPRWYRPSDPYYPRRVVPGELGWGRGGAKRLANYSAQERKRAERKRAKEDGYGAPKMVTVPQG